MAAKPKHGDAVLAMVRECAVRKLDLSASQHDRYADHVTLCASRVGIFARHVRYGLYTWRTRATSWFATPELAAVAFVEAVGVTRARKAALDLARRHGFSFPEPEKSDGDADVYKKSTVAG